MADHTRAADHNRAELLRLYRTEIPKLKKMLKESKDMLVQRDNSRQYHDERVQELVLENAELQERLDATQKQLTEAESDTCFMLRHNKRLESELRKMKKHMQKTKRANKVREEETHSEGSVSTSDGSEQSGEDLAVALPSIRTPVEPRTSGDTDIILAEPVSSRIKLVTLTGRCCVFDTTLDTIELDIEFRNRSRRPGYCGFQFVSYRTNKRHVKHDSAGRIASAVVISREKVRLQQASTSRQNILRPTPVEPSDDAQLEQNNANFVHRAIVWRYNRFASVRRSFFSSDETLPEHAPEERSYADNVPESPSAGTDRVTDFAVGHVRPYRPTLDETIYRATWKLQFTMDEANVTADLQGRILKCLYDNSQLPTRLADGNMEYSRVNLGTLLRHAGVEWTGGDIGMRGLSSLESIMNTYRSAGMPSIVSQDSQAYEFACSSCGDCICADRKTTKGDPRNIAIMGYWDGFQSSTTVLRSTWVVGIKLLNADSNSKIPPMPILFIPNSTDESTSQLDILDAALEPFIREYVDLFVNGIHVDYAYPTELVDASTSLSRSFTLRCMLVMFSGDHPAQCKFTGFSTGGLTGCRRCECLSRWKSRPGVGLGGIVEYHDNRKCYHYPPRAHSIQPLEEAAMEIARCETAAQRKKVTRRLGVVAKTRAWRLVRGVGLDLSRDLTFDSMHVLALCMFKKYIELLRKGAASSPQSKTALSRAMVEVTTAKPSFITGRWPKDIFNRLGYFKAEECSKFIIYCVPHILYELGYHTGSALYQLGLLLIQIARMFYLLHRSGDGWTADSLDRCRFALASWWIRSEELLGPNSSILEHVAGAGHMVDDIIRHGPSNVYWSYGFERLVAGYNKVKTKNRNMEHSFNFHYARVLFAKCMVQIWEDDDGLLPHERVLRTGIGIGSKRSKVCTIQKGLKVYLTRFWRESEATPRGEEIPEISDRIVQLKTVLIRGKVFKPGDHVIVLDETRADLADGDILALETEEWRDRNFLFAPSAIGHPPPYPELHDILLVCHADDCRFTGVETCVVRRIETEDGDTSDNLPQVMVDGLDCTSPRQVRGKVEIAWLRQNDLGAWIVRPSACCTTITFGHLLHLCKNCTVVAYSGDKPIKWISGG
ncbi:hypothetical protein R1sor_010284 [Riccia sorocarpa]|uniref:Uncharacterized protein n=1 Tax=Riccia sorocarpa TaxID=122646 RepID=A0ABD3HXN0_9MARC